MAPTQDALYADIDLDLSWSERDLPQRERTRHVHGLHPYLGKFIPQLVDVLLERYFERGDHVLDRAARSARLTTHFDLDFPREPQVGPYWCYKHRRECTPVLRAAHFLRR